MAGDRDTRTGCPSVIGADVRAMSRKPDAARDARHGAQGRGARPRRTTCRTAARTRHMARAARPAAGHATDGTGARDAANVRRAGRTARTRHGARAAAIRREQAKTPRTWTARGARLRPGADGWPTERTTGRTFAGDRDELPRGAAHPAARYFRTRRTVAHLHGLPGDRRSGCHSCSRTRSGARYFRLRGAGRGRRDGPKRRERGRRVANGCGEIAPQDEQAHHRPDVWPTGARSEAAHIRDRPRGCQPSQVAGPDGLPEIGGTMSRTATGHTARGTGTRGEIGTGNEPDGGEDAARGNGADMV